MRARELAILTGMRFRNYSAMETVCRREPSRRLTNFQRIVRELGGKAKAFGNQRLEGKPEIESTSPVSDLVKVGNHRNWLRKRFEVGRQTRKRKRRLENLQELVNAAVDYDEQGPDGIRDFIDHSALVADTDQIQSRRAGDVDDCALGQGT